MDKKRDTHLRDTAIRQSIQGKLEEAIDTLRGVGDINIVSDGLSHIAFEQAKKGNDEDARIIFSVAKKTCEKIGDRLQKDLALRYIAYRQAESQMFEYALETAKDIETSENQNWTYNHIAYENSKIGRFKEAKEIANRMTNPSLLCPLYLDIAEYEIANGFMHEALNSISSAKVNAKMLKSRAVKLIVLKTVDELIKEINKRKR
jgi:tetratricopeptide (TPR) repeat protein